MYAIDLLKSAVEGLAEPDMLSNHPLTTAKFVEGYLSRHPEFQARPRGEILGRALAVLWRERCLPLALKGRLKREWNLFLTLEVWYFYPFRHERPFPGGLPQLGGLLLDREHVARVIADGDEARAQTLLQSDYADLWDMIVPSNRKDTLALGISTVALRRDAALHRLAKELEIVEAQRETTAASAVISTSAASDTLVLYREYMLAAAPAWVPDEWSDILDSGCTTARLSIVGTVGSGKTELLHALAQRLCQTEAIPVYLRVCDYASQAPQQDFLQFAATQSEFSQCYLVDEELLQNFIRQLAEAYRADRLILLADQLDDIYDREWRAVIQLLQRFPRLIVAERTPRFASSCGITCQRQIYSLSAASAAALVHARGSEADHVQQLIADFRQWAVPLLPGILMQVAQAAPDDDSRHPVMILPLWINQQLTKTRSTATASTEIDQARRLLRYLADIRYDIAPHPEANTYLTRENVRRAFWSLALTPDKEEHGWHLIEFCCRAGIIQPVHARWEFTQSAIERALAAEFIIEETNWMSLHPHQRDLMRWTAALIARQATDQRQLTFIQELRRVLINATRLSAIEAADVLAELAINETVEARTFKAEVIEQLQGLKQLRSRRLASTAQDKIERLNGASHDSVESASGFSPIPSAQFQTPVHTLSEVLSELGFPVPAGTEERWLEDRRVLRGLIDGLCQATPPEVKRDCAAWLNRAPLSKVLEVHVPEQRWWKSRTRSALEVLAQRALEPEEDELTRRWLYTLLAHEDRVRQLWQRGDEYLPLVYELLLALDQRLFLVTGLLTQPEWRIMS